jgi:negative regulator of sigma E activity
MDTHWIERLSEYRDGELSEGERVACAAHLATCAGCREALEEIEAVIHAVRAEPDSTPANDLWPGIHARIAPVSAGVAPHQEWSLASARRRRQITFTLPQLALAASLLIAVSAAVAYVAAGRTTGTPPLAYETPILAVTELPTARAAEVTPANFADAQFDQAVTDLERTLLAQRDRLDPRTVMVIERNLRTIDDAIRQAREALDADPANMFLNSHLAEARKRKIELLRRATSIAGN